MKTLSSDKTVTRLATDAIFLAAALILSMVESLIPFFAVPIPGFKLGLANLAVTLACFVLSPADAAVISLIRCAMVFLLFGNPVSLAYSVTGSVFAMAVLTVLYCTKLSRSFSFVGISVMCAAAHNVGQITAAVLIMGTPVLSYMPVLLISSVVCGALTGLIIQLLANRYFFRKNDNPDNPARQKRASISRK